jgi:tight adherence protein B
VSAGGAWLGAALSGLAAALGIVVVALLADAWSRGRRSRAMLDRIGSTDEPEGNRNPLELFRENGGGAPDALDLFAAALPRSGDLSRLLAQSGLPWSSGRFVLLTVLSALAGGALGFLVTGYLMMAVPPGIFAATLPWLYARRSKARRVAAFEEAFPDAIELLGRAVRAGHAFSTALRMVADEMGAPLGPEFRRVFEEQKFGLPLEESMAGLADRVDLSDVRIFRTGVLIPRAVGGNLAEILDNLSSTIRQRFTIQRQVRVYTAQGRATGYLLAVLPVALGGLIYLLNHDYMSILWTEGVGRILIVGALLLQIAGFFVIRRIVNIEV